MKKSLLCLTIIVTGALSSTTFAAPGGREAGVRESKTGTAARGSDPIERFREAITREEQGKFDRMEQNDKTQLKNILDLVASKLKKPEIEVDLGRSYLDASPAGRSAISQLVNKTVDVEVGKSILAVSALRITPDLTPTEINFCNRVFELSAEIPGYMKEGKSISGEKASTRRASEIDKPESWGEFVELVLFAKKQSGIDVVKFLVEKLGEQKVEELLKCKI